MSRTFLTLCVLLVSGVPIAALANTITVDTLVDEAATDNGNCTLREAILAANTDAAVDTCAAGGTGSDTINFAVAGFINLVDALPKVDEPLEIVGPGAAELNIAGNQFAWPIVGGNTAGIFLFEGASPLTSDVMPFKLKGLTLVAGTNLNSPLAGTGTGGCISVRNQSDLTLDHVRIRNCYSGSRGGAIHFETPAAFIALGKSGLTVLWSQIDYNQSSGFGGGIYVASDADVAIRYSTINNNLGQSGGGGLAMKPASATGATLEVDHATFSQNATTGFIGGAIALLDPGPTNYPWTANIVNSTIVENTAHDGEVPLFDPPPNCSSEGAGIAVRDANLTFNIENTIATGNVDKDFDRIACSDTDLYIPIDVPATVTTGSTNWMGSVVYFGPDLFGDGSPNAQGDHVNVGAADLKVLGDYGGPTPTRSPVSAGSNVVDRNGVCDNASGEPYDQRGYGTGLGRVSGISCDIGAVEFGAGGVFDYDQDGVVDDNDNCPLLANSGQENLDGDALGNVCDSDVDGDGTQNAADPDDDNDGLLDADEPGAGGDPYDPDSDDDGIIDGLDRAVGSDSNNICKGLGSDVELNQVIGETVTCAATSSITMTPGAGIKSEGDLLLISPSVRFAEFAAQENAALTVIPVDPTATNP